MKLRIRLFERKYLWKKEHSLNKRLVIFAAWIMILSMLCLSGCGDKKTTVADSVDNEETEYKELSRIEVKSKTSDGKESIGSCVVMIPKDYKESETTKGLYVSSLYPLDASNIYITTEDSEDLGFVNDALSAEAYEKAVENAYRTINNPIDLVIDEFNREDMQGVLCFKIRSHYLVDGEELQQLVYIIAAKETYVITYTQMSDDDLLADFVNAEGTIKLIKEKSQA